MKRLNLGVALLALCAGGVCDGIAAAAEVTQTPSPPQTAAATGAPATNASGGLTEVVVTATRRAQNLQRVAAAVSSVSGAEVSNRGVVLAEDLNRLVPGLGIANQGAATQVYLRGVGTFTPPIGDSSVLVQVDGVVMGEPAMVGGNFYDLQRVEVLKGPQGTLYGRNATAGAINIITNKPDFDFGADAMLEIGNYDAVRFAGTVNAPVNDKIALRVSTQEVYHDGYFTDGSGNDKSQAFRGEALFQATDDLSVLLGITYSHQGGNGSPYVAVPVINPNDPWVGASTILGNSRIVSEAQTTGLPSVVPSFLVTGAAPNVLRNVPAPGLTTLSYALPDNTLVDSNVRGVHAELNWNLDFAKLVVLPAFYDEDFEQVLDPGFITEANAGSHQTSVETRLSSPDSSNLLKWIVGFFYFDETTHQSDEAFQLLASQYLISNRHNDSYAGFGEVTYSILDSLRLTGGLRYTDEDRSITGNQTTIESLGGPGAPFFSYNNSVTNRNVSYKVGLEYDLAPRSLLYANVSTGFRSGGLNPEYAPNTYKPERMTAYSIGSKNRFFDNRLQVNVEAYYWDYNNHQEDVLLGENVGPQGSCGQACATILTVNAQKATIKGVSFDLKYRFTDNDVFAVDTEYSDSQYGRFIYTNPLSPAQVAGTTSCAIGPAANGQTTIDCSGKPLTRAPRWSENISYDHTFDLPDGAALIAGADAQVASSNFIATDYIANERQGTYSIINADLTYHSPGGDWSIGAFVRNLTNAVVYNSAFEQPFIPNLVYATLRAPQTFGATFKIRY